MLICSMLAVWVVEREGKKVSILKKERSLEIALHTLKQAGVEGVMVDVWWGLVERAGPRCYDFSAYQSLFRKVARAGLKVQAVMSFHAAGGNVGDTCKIPLPRWILDIGDKDPDIYYTDKSGHRNRECLSLGCDEVPIFWGRTPVDMYSDFIEAFVENFHPLFGGCSDACTLRMRRMHPLPATSCRCAQTFTPMHGDVPRAADRFSLVWSLRRVCADRDHGRPRARRRAAVPGLPGGRRALALPRRGRVPVLRQVHAPRPQEGSGCSRTP